MDAIFSDIKQYNKNKNNNAIKIFSIFKVYLESIDKSNIIGDLKTDYEELFLEILKKVEEFDNEVIDSALR